MAVPDTWGAPVSGGTAPGTFHSNGFVSYAGGYWFAASYYPIGGTVSLRYTTDPTGSWSTATLPAPPSGSSVFDLVVSGGVQYDGTDYAFSILYTGGTTTRRSRIIHASDPAGSWSSYQWDATDANPAYTILHDGTQWALAGQRLTTAPQPAFIAYAPVGSAVNSTYTIGTSDAATGLPISAAGASGTWRITSLEYNSGTYVLGARLLDATALEGHLRYATSLNGTWTEPTGGTVDTINTVKAYGNYWVTVGPEPTPWYTNDPTGTWTQLGTATSGLNQEVLSVAYGGGNWVLAGAGSVAGSYYPRMSYATSASPGVAATSIGSTVFTQDPSDLIWSVEYGNGYFVALSSYQAEIRYSNVPTIMSTFLRQRQSPVRSPSRVRPTDLRQRQTPYIT